MHIVYQPEFLNDEHKQGSCLEFAGCRLMLVAALRRAQQQEPGIRKLLQECRDLRLSRLPSADIGAQTRDRKRPIRNTFALECGTCTKAKMNETIFK